MGISCILHIMKNVNLMGKKHPYYGKSMSTNFPGSPHTMGFVGFSRKPTSQAFPIWWVFLPSPLLRKIDQRTHTFPIWWSKYTTGWESNGKKAPILWKKYGNHFSRFSPFDRFCCLFQCYGKLMRKPMHFPCDEVYHRMGI